MPTVGWIAEPWWVNLLVLVPVIHWWAWRSRRLALAGNVLIYAALFGLAFGFVEASVVVYLRAATGMLPGYEHGTLADVQRLSADYQQQLRDDFPHSLITVEICREAATMLMLIAVACLAAPRRRERWATFLWSFALWDIAYYAGLWATVRWPHTLRDVDVLFLIPVPWLAQVWFPLLVSSLCLVAVPVSREDALHPR